MITLAISRFGTVTLLGIWLMMLGLVLVADSYPPVRFSGVLINKSQIPSVLVNGTFNTIVDTSEVGANDVPTKKWGYKPSVVFKNGLFELLFPAMDSVDISPASPQEVVPPSGYQFDYPNIGLAILASGASEVFRLRSYPYSVRSQLTDYAYGALVEAINLTDALQFVTASNTMEVSGLGVRVNSQNLQIGGVIVNPAHRLDVEGFINASAYWINGVPFNETLPWQSNALNAMIKTIKRVGVGLVFPQSDVDIGGTLNATQLYVNGAPLEFGNVWANPFPDNEVTMASPLGLLPQYRVGMGVFRPSERLELDGALRVSADFIRVHPTGSIQFGLLRNPVYSSQFNRDFQGKVASGDTTEWRSLLGYARESRVQRVGFFMPQSPVNESETPRSKVGATGLDFFANTGRIGLGLASDAIFSLKPLSSQLGVPILSVRHQLDGTVYPVFTVSSTGNIGVGTTQPAYALDVQGLLNVQDLYVDGAPYRLSRSRGTYFQRNVNSDIFYLYGNVGIGRPDPMSKLEISAPNVDKGDGLPDPALTISRKAGSNLVSYTLGVHRKSQDVFRVEYGRTVGSDTPLFVAQRDRFGVGTSVPRANLMVVGTGGLLLTGGFPNGDSLEPVTENAVLIWYPKKNALRIGGGAIPILDSQMGLFSTAIGQDHIAKGNYSMIMGGNLNQVEGAYSNTLGGRQLWIRDTSDFSLAMGMGLTLQHHGVWGWGDRSYTVNTASQQENQFLIRAGGGVGIGTNRTVAGSVSPQTVSLAVSGVGVTPYLFLDRPTPIFLVDPTDNAVALVDTLLSDGILNSDGQLATFSREDSTLLIRAPYSSYPSIKTVLNEVYDRPILTLINSTQPLLTALNSETVLIGYPAGNRRGLMMTGPMVAGLSDRGGVPSASLHMILNSPGNALPLSSFAMAIMTQKSGGVSYNLVLDERGNLGIHRIPTFKSFNQPESVPRNPENRSFYLDVAGSVAVEENLSWWNGQVLVLGQYVSDPWMVTSYNDQVRQVVFPSGNPVMLDGLLRLPVAGNVGIGTASPNHTLTLSNRSSYANLLTPVRWPEVTFDENDTDYFTVGRRSIPHSLFIYSGGSTVDESNLLNSPLVIQPNRVGILTMPVAGTTLEVGGMMAITAGGSSPIGALSIQNARSQLGILNVNRADISTLFIGDSIIDWYRGTQANAIYRYTNLGSQADPIYSYIGFGTTDPQVDIDVQGVVRATRLVASMATFNIVTMGTPLAILEQGSEVGRLYFSDDRLVFQNSGSNVVLSDIMTEGESLRGGYLGLFTKETPQLVSKSSMYWKPNEVGLLNGISPGTWSVTGSMQLVHGVGNTSFNYTAVSSVNQTIGLNKSASLYRGPLLSNSYPYTLETMRVHLIPRSAENSYLYNTHVTGIAITVSKNVATTQLSSGVKLVGLNVDLTKANKQSVGVQGEKIVAILKGDVGIGTTKPKATLDVNGSVIANQFVIGSELNIVTINVGASVLDIGLNRGIGIGGVPSVNGLEVKNTAQFNDLTARVIQTPMFQVNRAVFNVSNSKRVGIGLMEPIGLLHTKHTLGVLQGSPQSGFSVNTIIPELGDDGRNVFYAMGMMGINVSVRSAGDPLNYAQDVNFLGRRAGGTKIPAAYGLYVDATALKLDKNPNFASQTPSLRGVSIQMPGYDAAYPVVFMNQTMPTRVGIGLTNPTYELDIDGDMRVSNLVLDDGLPFWIFQTIYSKSVQVLNQVTVNQRVSTQYLKGEAVSLFELELLNSWDNPGGIMRVALATINSVSATRLAATQLIGGDAGSLRAWYAFIPTITTFNAQYIESGVSLREPTAVLSRVDIGRALSSRGVSVPERLIVRNNRVGVGGEPGAVLHVVSAQTDALKVASPNSWASVVLQQKANVGVANRVGIAFLFNNMAMAGVQSARGSQVDQPESSDHNLVFLVQDAPENPLTPAMTVFKDGKVGIGIPDWPESEPGLSILYVSGNVNSRFLTAKTISAKSIDLGTKSGGFVAPTRFLNTLFDEPIQTNRLDLAPYNSEQGFSPDFIYLLVRDNQLMLRKNTNELPFGNRIERSPNTLLWYDNGGLLSNTTTGSILVTNGLVSITINSSQSDSGMKIRSSMGQDTESTLLAIRGSLPARAIGATGVTLNGVAILAGGGALNSNSDYTGLKVTLTNLPTDSYNGAQLQRGTKMAAQFLSGVDATNGWLLGEGFPVTSVTASVRLVGDASMGGDAVWVGNSVGWQLAIPTAARLLLRPQGASIPTNALLAVYSGSIPLIKVSQGNGSTFLLKSTGIQIGSALAPNLSNQLGVEGLLRARDGYFSWVSTNVFLMNSPKTLSITNPMNEVASKVGIGTIQPEYQLDIQSIITGNAISLASSNMTLQRLYGNLQFNSFTVSMDIKGLDINFQLGRNESQDSAIDMAPSATAHLLRIMMNNARLESSAKATGLFVSISSPNRAAGILMGGRVGIGVDEPSESLDLLGVMRGNTVQLTQESDWNGTHATINQMTLIGEAIVPEINLPQQTITINKLYVSESDTVVLPSATNSDLFEAERMVAQFASMNTLVVNTDMGQPGVTLYVSGNASLPNQITVRKPLDQPKWEVPSLLTIVPAVMFDSTLKLNTHYLMTPLLQLTNDAISSGASEGRIRFANDSLWVYKSSGWFELSKSKSAPNRLAIFDPSNTITANLAMAYSATLKTVTLSASLRLNTVVSFNVPSAIRIMAIDSNIPMRNGEAEGELVGMKVVVTSNIGDILGASDTLVGLLVSVNPTIDDPYYLPDGTRINSQAMAAYFNNSQASTGNLLIDETGVGPLISTATLHIRPKDGAARLMVATHNIGERVQIITSSMTIGLINNNASLGMLRDGNQWGVYKVGARPIEGGNGKIRVATINYTHDLNTTTLKAITVNVSSQLTANELMVNLANGSPLLWATSSGFTGIGTTLPSAVLDFKREWASPENEAIQPSVDMGIQGWVANSARITGINIKLEHTSGIRSAPQSMVRGAVIDSRQLNAISPTHSVGLQVAVSDNQWGARFEGKVGIGVDPTESLSVGGGITLNQMLIQSTLNSQAITATMVTINEGATINRYLVVQTANVDETIRVENDVSVPSTGTWYTQLGGNASTIPNGATAQSIKLTEMLKIAGLQDLGFELLANKAKITQLRVPAIDTVSKLRLRQLNALSGVTIISGNMKTDRVAIGMMNLIPTGSIISLKTIYNQSGVLKFYVDTVPYRLMPTGSPTQLITFGATEVKGLSTGLTLNVLASTIGFRLNRSLEITVPINSGEPTPVVGSAINVILTDRPAPNYDATQRSTIMLGASVTSVGSGNSADTLSGVVVSMDALADTSTTPLPSLIDKTQFSKKVAAAFMSVRPGESGGSVGIIADNSNTIPTINQTLDATLVLETTPNLTAFVAKSKTNKGVWVSPTGDMTLGSSQSNAAQLVVDQELRLDGESSGQVMTLQSDKIGIGTHNPTAVIHVVGNSDALSMDSSQGPVLQVTANGRVALGSTNPVALMTVSGDIRVVQASTTVIQTNTQKQVSIKGASLGSTPRNGDVGIKGSVLIGDRPTTIDKPFTIGSSNSHITLDSGGDVSASSGKWKWGSASTPFQYDTNWSIGTTQNTAVLSVGAKTGAVMALYHADNSATMVVSANASIGLNTQPLAENRLTIKGDVKISNMAVDGLVASDSTFVQVSVVTASIVGVVQAVVGKLDTDFDQTLMGVSILNQATSDKPTVKGVMVDVDGIETLDPNLANGPDTGKKIAAILTGGPVIIDAMNRLNLDQTISRSSIGVPTPSLLVMSGGLIGMTASSRPQSSQRTIRLQQDASTTQELQVDAVTALSVGSTGHIGVNTSAPTDVKFMIGGDMRVGLQTVADSQEAILGAVEPGDGNQLLFSGGPRLSGAANSDNTDTFSLSRFNYKQGVSELRFRVDDADTTNPHATFALVHSDTHHLVIQRKGYADPNDIAKAEQNLTEVSYRPAGHVGIGTSNPVAVLDVWGDLPARPQSNADIKEMSTTPSARYLVTIQNKNSVPAPLLALQNNGSSAKSTFIRFFNSKDTQTQTGQFRMQSLSPGVVFEALGADYAEYVPRGTVTTPSPGDVVSIEDGRTSFNTNGNGVLMVISERPIVVGNWQSDRVSMDMISFMGQVDLKIEGPVQAGDYLIPSGRHDGRAKVWVSGDPIHQIIGVALVSSTPNATHVTALVGMPIRNRLLGQQMAELAAYRQEATRIREQTRRMAVSWGNRLDALDATRRP